MTEVTDLTRISQVDDDGWLTENSLRVAVRSATRTALALARQAPLPPVPPLLAQNAEAMLCDRHVEGLGVRGGTRFWAIESSGGITQGPERLHEVLCWDALPTHTLRAEADKAILKFGRVRFISNAVISGEVGVWEHGMRPTQRMEKRLLFFTKTTADRGGNSAGEIWTDGDGAVWLVQAWRSVKSGHSMCMTPDPARTYGIHGLGQLH